MITRTEIVTKPERFAEIEPAWQDLWQSSGASVFQSHGWIAAWYRHVEAGYELRIGLAWDGDRLLTVLPCAIRRYQRVRILEWAAQVFSDHCDAFGSFSLLPSLWTEVIKPVDVIYLRNVAGDGLATGLFSTLPLTRTSDLTLTVRSQWPDGTAWFRTLNKKKRNNHTRGRRILDEMGTVTIDYHRDRAPAHTIERLVDLKQAWLRANGLTSPLLDQGSTLLHELVDVIAATGKLCLVQITCNDEIVAGTINVVEGRSLLAFFAAYDPKFDRASPGIMLMVEYTKWAFDNGFQEVDYLRGDEMYKYEFANHREMLQSYMGAASITGEVAIRLFKLGRKLKTFRAPPEKMHANGGAYTTQAGTSRLKSEPVD